MNTGTAAARIEKLYKQDQKFQHEYPQFKKKASEWFPKFYNKRPQWVRLYSFVETSGASMETLWYALEECQKRGKADVGYFMAIVRNRT